MPAAAFKCLKNKCAYDYKLYYGSGQKKQLSVPFLASRSASSLGTLDSLIPRDPTNSHPVDSRKSIKGFLAVFNMFGVRMQMDFRDCRKK